MGSVKRNEEQFSETLPPQLNVMYSTLTVHNPVFLYPLKQAIAIQLSRLAKLLFCIFSHVL